MTNTKFLEPPLNFLLMDFIIVLIIVSFGVAVIFLAAFLWSVKNGQYDDTYTPSVRILFDDKYDKN